VSSRQCEENTLHVPTWVDVSLPVGSKTLLIAHKSRTTATERLPLNCHWPIDISELTHTQDPQRMR